MAMDTSILPGEIRTWKELGLKRCGRYQWAPCAKCGTYRFVYICNGRLRSRYCPECGHSIGAVLTNEKRYQQQDGGIDVCYAVAKEEGYTRKDATSCAGMLNCKKCPFRF